MRAAVVDTANHYPRATTHHNAFRFMIPTEVLAKDDVLRELYPDTECRNLVSWVRGEERVIAYPVDFGRQVNLVCTHPEQLSDADKEGSISRAQVGMY